MSWLSVMVRTGDINGVALVLISEQGTGKGLVVNFLRWILGNNNVAEIVGIASITQKHNTVLQNKRMTCVNEMSANRDEFRSNFDKIKAYITDPFITIEPKCVNPYVVDNIGNFILVSNHQDSIILEESDRRYSVFKVSDKYINNTAFFKNLADNCYNQETANVFYTYLLNYDCVNTRKIIDTDIRREITSISKPTTSKFLDHLVSNPPHIDDDDDDASQILNRTNFTATDLYDCFRDWCSSNGERRIVTMTKFGFALKKCKNITKHRTNRGVRYRVLYDNTCS